MYRLTLSGIPPDFQSKIRKLDSFPLKVEHKYSRKSNYPVIFKEEKDLNILISQKELNQIPTLDELMEKVNSKMI